MAYIYRRTVYIHKWTVYIYKRRGCMHKRGVVETALTAARGTAVDARDTVTKISQVGNPRNNSVGNP